MLQTEFQASKPKGSKETGFRIFSMYFFDLKIVPPGAGPS